jgi:hypothetical protein
MRTTVLLRPLFLGVLGVLTAASIALASAAASPIKAVRCCRA